MDQLRRQHLRSGKQRLGFHSCWLTESAFQDEYYTAFFLVLGSIRPNTPMSARICSKHEPD